METLFMKRVRRPVTFVATIVFGIIALVHLARLILGWEITLNGLVVPMWPSGIFLGIAGGLAFLLWREARLK